MTSAFPHEAPDLSICENEPIHIPGAIQPHGVLLALDEDSFIIEMASTNTSDLLGRSHTAVIGQPLASLVDAASLQRLRTAAAMRPLRRANPVPVTIAQRDYHATLHRSDGLLVAELEPASSVDRLAATGDLAAVVDRLRTVRALDDLFTAMVDEIQALSGFDRVMIYRFHEDLHGEVIAEALRPGVGNFSYLGLHYPASDIPAQARRLYTLNWIRAIPDIAYRPCAVLPATNPRTSRPLDMSHAVLRSVSPVHLEYLANMTVQASMSISIVRDDKLWGLIACHHATPKTIPYPIRLACETLACTCSWMLDSLERMLHTARHARIADAKLLFVQRLSRGHGLQDALLRDAPNLLDIVDTTGVAVRFDGRWETAGTTPPGEALEALTPWLEQMDGSVLATDAVAEHHAAAHGWQEHGAGVLALCFGKKQRNYVVWFRPEWVHTVRWGGNRLQPVWQERPGARIAPRRSFAAWEETVSGHSQPWTPYDIEAARGLLEIAMGEEIERAAEIAKLNVDLATALRGRDEFISVASHELKTPIATLGIQLAAIGRMLDRSDEAVAPETLREKIALAKRQIDRLDILVGQLLDVSQLAEGRTRLAPSYIDLAVLCREVVERLNTGAGTGPRIALDAPRPVRGLWDPFRCEQVVANLLSNALKYSSGATVELHVDAIGAAARIRVIDRGVGVPPEAMTRIFERFERARPEDHIAGLGLGLWIVRQIVEQHQGSVDVESVVGQGSTFTVTLPRDVQGPPSNARDAPKEGPRHD